MANAIIQLPIPYIGDFSKGRPIFNGKIYVGVIDTDPEVPINQLQVVGIQENGTEVNLPQPVLTGSGGYPIYNGSPIRLTVDGDYSLKILDKNNNQIYYFANVLQGAPIVRSDNPIFSHATLLDAVADLNIEIGNSVQTQGEISSNDGNGSFYVVVAGGTGTAGSRYVNTDNGLQLWLTGTLVKTNPGNQSVSAGYDSLDTIGTDVRFSTAFGYRALASQTTGTSNTAIGTSALENTEGDSSANNVAVGRFALQANISGFDNTAVGSSALIKNTEGKANTAIGKFCMTDCLTGKDNVALGEGAMPRLKAASSNVAVGVNACQYTDEDGSGTADTNTGVGAGSMLFNRLGKNNIAVGNAAMEGYKQGDLAVFTVNVSGGVVTNVNVILGGFGYTSVPSVFSAGGGGTGATYTAIMVDDGTGAGTFKVASVTVDTGGSGYTSSPTAATVGGGLGDAGRLEGGAYDQNNNTAVGQLALGGLLDGDENVAVGRNAGGGIKDGLSNVVIGNDALAIAEATNCIVIGRNAASDLDTLGTAVVIGTNALTATTPSLGLSGIAAIGYEALRDCEGDNNTAIGTFASRLLTTATGSTSLGNSAMGTGVITGNNNTAMGSSALSNVTTGFNNTAIGRDALTVLQNTNPHDNEFNCSGIGFQAAVSGSNQIQLGNASTTTYAYGAVQDRSDMRDKADIQGLTDGHVNFILAVDWKLFKWDMREDYREYDEDGRVIGQLERDGSKKRSRFHAGVIAQEVKEKADASGIDFGGYQDHSVGGGCDVRSIGYAEFIPYLGELCQRQQKTIEEIMARLEVLENK